MPLVSSWSSYNIVYILFDFELQQMVAKSQIELLTSQAWYSENQELEDKVIPKLVF